jgi:hypothetical protein
MPCADALRAYVDSVIGVLVGDTRMKSVHSEREAFASHHGVMRRLLALPCTR